MARLFVNVGDKLSVTSAPVVSYPVSMACWFYTTSNSASQYLMTLEDSVNLDFNALQLRGDQASDPLFAQTYDGSTASNASTSTGYSTSTWQHAAAVFAASNSRAVYLDGAGKGTNTTNRVTSNMTTTTLGNKISADRALVGAIANAAMWDVALTDADVLQLAKGVCPLHVKPENLVAYWPLVGKLTTEIDIVGGYGLSITGAVSVQSGRWVYQTHRRTA